MRYGNTFRRALPFALSCQVFTACILVPEFDEFDSVIDSCVQENPEVPPHCRGSCDGSEVAGASCSIPGQLCTRAFENDCIYQATCSEYRVWTGSVFCPRMDAGTEDAAPEMDANVCLGCADFLLDPTFGMPCAASKAYYDSYMDCACNRGSLDTPPGCKDVCGDNLCTGIELGMPCFQCSTTTCTTEFGNCAGDI